MLNVSDDAINEVNAFFADKEKSPIRIFLTQGCSGPAFAMALDAPDESRDEVIDTGGHKFVVEKELLEHAQPISIDVTQEGFVVSSNLQMPAQDSGGGCAGCAGGC